MQTYNRADTDLTVAGVSGGSLIPGFLGIGSLVNLK